jgi:RimJ/RimL family protein N-acetyltransferase
VPQQTDLQVVRESLDRDRDWAAYAIGDLAPGFVEHCEWLTTSDASGALILVYRGFTPPIVFAMGSASAAGALFAEIAAPTISLHVQADALDAMSGTYEPTDTRKMLRMTLRRDAFRPVVAPADVNGGPTMISEHHLDAVEALYQDGHERGEGPTFFSPSMLRQETFRGIWEGDALIALAGTHLYSAEMGVCAIGNVYTRHDRRGRGLGARVTSAVIDRALQEHVRTIVLNVSAENVAARRVYERLGFTVHCEFFEGEAVRRAGSRHR